MNGQTPPSDDVEQREAVIRRNNVRSGVALANAVSEYYAAKAAATKTRQDRSEESDR